MGFNYVDFHTSGGYDRPLEFVPERWQATDKRHANYIPFGIKEARSCPAQHMASFWMREIWCVSDMFSTFLNYPMTPSYQLTDCEKRQLVHTHITHALDARRRHLLNGPEA